MGNLEDNLFKELAGIAGDEFTSRDPAICAAYSRGGYGRLMYDVGSRSPGCVVLPSCAEEVQSIVKLANTWGFKYVPVSTFFSAYCPPLEEDARPTVVIDMKRMDKLRVDIKNMYAVVEPYVTYAQMHSETLKYGLYTSIPLSGAQCSVLANHLTYGMGLLVYRAGYANRRILGCEWILPSGEILQLGSLGGGEPFWGEGPGPDLRGLVRGYFGHFGGLGIVTKMAVKLFPMPETVPDPQGISPDTTFTLPRDKFRWYVITYRSPEKAVDALCEIGRSEIGSVCTRIPSIWRYASGARSTDEFWSLWSRVMDRVEKERPSEVRVMITGFTSIEQVEYEERVLRDIALETGGVFLEIRGTASSECFKASKVVRAYRPSGNFISQKFGFDSMDQAVKFMRKGRELLYREYVPPFVDDKEECGWILGYDFSHYCHGEFTFYFDKEDSALAIRFELESLRQDLDGKAYPGMQLPHLHNMAGPSMGNYHLLLQKLSRTLDPKGLSNRGLVTTLSSHESFLQA